MKKPRTTIISVELREDTQFNWNEKEKRFELLNSDGEISTKNLVSFGEGYARDKKPPKILRQLMSQIGGVIQPAAEENYADRYISIDTSYRSFGDNNLCVTAGMSTEQELDHKRGLLKGETLTGFLFPRACFIARPGANPERYGWMKVIEAVVRWKNFKPECSYGIIVDSELGLIPKMNAREEPLFGDFFLPDNMTLIYASADAGQENFYNKLIKATDQVAAISLKLAVEMHTGIENYSFEGTHVDLPILTGNVDFKL